MPPRVLEKLDEEGIDTKLFHERADQTLDELHVDMETKSGKRIRVSASSARRRWTCWRGAVPRNNARQQAPDLRLPFIRRWAIRQSPFAQMTFSDVDIRFRCMTVAAQFAQ